MNIIITGAGLRNTNFQVERGSSFFPADSWGGNNQTKAGQSVCFLFEGTNERVETDLDTEKRVPRRARGEIGRFFKFHNAKEGESIEIVRIAERQYTVRMKRAESRSLTSPETNIIVPPSGNETPTRTTATTERVVRDTAVTRYIKSMYDYECQVCGVRLLTKNGPYAEGAHVRPLGTPHNGSDVVENVLCLCPNHHVMFDGGTLYIGLDHSISGGTKKLRIAAEHKIKTAFLQYHLSNIAKVRDA